MKSLARALTLIAVVAIAHKPIVPISVIIPCNVEDFHFLPLVLASIANQTALPEETILVANLPPTASNGVLLIDTSKRSQKLHRSPEVQVSETAVKPADRENLFSWLFQNVYNPTTENLVQSEELPILSDVVANASPTELPPTQEAVIDTGTQELLGIELEGLGGPGATISPSDALDALLATLPDAKISIATLPRLKVYVRSGTHYAGANRVFGGLHASTDIVSFFDADDYMHPQRMQRLWEMFQANRDLDALIHGFVAMKITEWQKRLGSLTEKNFSGNPTKFVLPYEDYWNSLPRHKLTISQREPVYDNPAAYAWWFPKDMDLKWPASLPRHGHNGWLTLKKRVLEEVPYPDIRRGQDSLYNWRLILARKRWNFLPDPLGAYIAYK